MWTDNSRNILSENYLADWLRNLGRVGSAETGHNKVGICWLNIKNTFNYHHHQPSKRTLRPEPETPHHQLPIQRLIFGAKLLLYSASFSRSSSSSLSTLAFSFVQLTEYSDYLIIIDTCIYCRNTLLEAEVLFLKSIMNRRKDTTVAFGNEKNQYYLPNSSVHLGSTDLGFLQLVVLVFPCNWLGSCSLIFKLHFPTQRPDTMDTSFTNLESTLKNHRLGTLTEVYYIFIMQRMIPISFSWLNSIFANRSLWWKRVRQRCGWYKTIE